MEGLRKRVIGSATTRDKDRSSQVAEALHDRAFASPESRRVQGTGRYQPG
jgi:hypothetical protein